MKLTAEPLSQGHFKTSALKTSWSLKKRGDSSGGIVSLDGEIQVVYPQGQGFSLNKWYVIDKMVHTVHTTVPSFDTHLEADAGRFYHPK